MILTKEVEFSYWGKSINFLKSLGFINLKPKQKVKVSIKYLKYKSGKKVIRKCEICNKIGTSVRRCNCC